ncbi:hypothetical protein QWJ34_10340 [Saccharibacillus sp. CPCC 101409]|nr:hypothetical protein [Saccharibacillus sp. CPCC 101409]MDO3410160.1 hypothetical protein [Saccharibacillus sp. CPCC 101409]
MHPYLIEKLAEEEKRRLRHVEQTHWREEQLFGKRKRWGWGKSGRENRR